MVEGFIESADGDALIDDPDRVEGYRAVGIADGFITGSEAEQLRAWTYLVESGRAWELGGWFTSRGIELLATRMIKVSTQLPKCVSDEVDRQQRLASEYKQNDSLREKRDDSHD